MRKQYTDTGSKLKHKTGKRKGELQEIKGPKKKFLLSREKSGYNEESGEQTISMESVGNLQRKTGRLVNRV